MMTYPQYTQTRAQRAIFRLLFFAFLLIAYHSSLVTASAQSATASLSGTVEDQTGAVVAGASVTVMNVNTRLQREATTDAQGRFTIPLLPPSAYTVTVRRDGFAPLEIKDVTLNVGDQRALQIQLKLGKIDQTITVETASLINESPAVGTVIDRQFVGNLPLNGRSLQSLILLAPGVVVAAPSANSDPGQFSVNGQRANTNYFTVDGVSANIGVNIGTQGPNLPGFSLQAGGALPGLTASGDTSSLVSIDALEEFKIQTSTYSAEFGRQPGGHVQLVTRSGRNQFHGTAFEYLRNEVFDANDWFNNSRGIERPTLRQNQFGGTFSGPVIFPKLYSGRDHVFFFFSYEGRRLRLPVHDFQDVPSLRLRRAAEAAGSPVAPILNSFPVPNREEIQALIDHDNNPATPRVLGPTGHALFETSFSNPSTLDATSIRLDHVVNSRLTLFGRYAETPSDNLIRATGGGINILRGNRLSTRTLTMGATLSVTPRLNNDFRVNYGRNRGRFNREMDDFGGAVPIDPALLVSGYAGTGPVAGQMSFTFNGSSFAVALGDEVDSYQRQINVVDNVSWVTGAHQFKFGIDYRRMAPIYGPFEYRQNIGFNSEASILTVTPAGAVIPSNVNLRTEQGARPLYNNFSAYFQDTWRVASRLTLDLGLRWEMNPPPHDANGIEPVLVTGITGVDVSRAALAPRGTPFYKTIYTAFAPRIGAAYKLRQVSGWETVLRGGFGVYYDLGSGLATAGFGGFPFQASMNLPAAQRVFPLAPELVRRPSLPTVTLPISQLLAAINPDLKLPYTLQWNTTLQQSLGVRQTVTISYVAAVARRLLTTQLLNQGIPDLTTGEEQRPNANFNNIYFTSNGPTSDYHSLQTSYNRRLSRGLQILANYTWSHAIDEVSNEVQQGTLERGNAGFDIRHKFSAAISYDFPKLRAGIITPLLRNWSIDAAVIAQTGSPMEVFAGQMIREDGSMLQVRPDSVPDAPLWVDDPAAPGGRRINVAAFAEPDFVLVFPFPDEPTFFQKFYTRQGTLGRNVVRKPGIQQVNMSLRRQFKLSERVNLQLRTEVFNPFNHPLFDNYFNEWAPESSVFGVSFSTLNNVLQGSGGLVSLYQIGGPRSMQFSLRLGF